MIREGGQRRDEGGDGAIIVVKSAATADARDAKESRTQKQD